MALSENENKPAPTVIPPGYRLGPREVPDEPEGPPQFGLRGLLLFQAVFALFLVSLMSFGAWAILPVFAGTILLRWGPWRLKNRAWRLLAFDLMAGVALPVLCLRYDPIIFTDNNPVRMPAYLFIGIQIVGLLLWKMIDTMAGRPSAVLSGILAVGAFFAFLIGCLMIPLSLIGLLLLGIGLLGLTPFLTLWTFGDNAVAAFGSWPEKTLGRCGHMLGFCLGVVLAIALPLLLNWQFGDLFDYWLSQVSFPDFLGVNDF